MLNNHDSYDESRKIIDKEIARTMEMEDTWLRGYRLETLNKQSNILEQSKNIPFKNLELNISDEEIKANYKEIFFIPVLKGEYINELETEDGLDYTRNIIYYSGISDYEIIDKNDSKLNFLFFESFLEFYNLLDNEEIKQKIVIEFEEYFLQDDEYSERSDIIFSYMNIKDKFNILINYSKVEGVNNILDVLYKDIKRRFNPGDFYYIEKLIRTQKHPEIMYTLRVINNIMKTIAYVDLYDYTTFNAEGKFKNLLLRIKSNNKNQFVNYYIGLITNNIKQDVDEGDDYIGGFFDDFDEQNDEDFDEENEGEDLLSLFEKNSIQQETEVKISSDFIGIQNGKGEIKYIKYIKGHNNNNKISYQDLVADENININGDSNFENLALFLKEIHNSEMINEINQDLKIDITKLTLQTQIHLLRFLWTKTTEEFNEFKNALNNIEKEEDKYNFLNTFLACSEDLLIGNKIIELSKQKGADEIFRIYSELVNLQSEINSENVDLLTFLKVILKRGKKLLETGKIDDNISSELVKSGAFMKAIMKKEGNNIMNIDTFNEMNPYFKVEKINGGNIIKSGTNKENISKLDLVQDDIYSNINDFGSETYKMLYQNIEDTYEGIDDEWTGVLIRNIINDITNKDVNFYILKDKETNKTIALCKIKQQGENKAYFGSHYVKEKYRGDFGLGQFVADLAFKDYKEGITFSGTVAVNNPSLERHINYGGFVGNEIVKEFDEKGSSRELVQIQKNNLNFKTTDKKEYSDDFLKQNSGKQIDNYEVLSLNSSFGNDENFINVLKDRFEKGYYLTRLFYDKNNYEPDLTKTYVVFENIT